MLGACWEGKTGAEQLSAESWGDKEPSTDLSAVLPSTIWGSNHGSGTTKKERWLWRPAPSVRTPRSLIANKPRAPLSGTIFGSSCRLEPKSR
jgi:hypothetical protein